MPLLSKNLKGLFDTSIYGGYMLNALCFLCSILNKLTPEKFDVLKGQLIDSGITSTDILKVNFLVHIFSIPLDLYSCQLSLRLILNAGCDITYIRQGCS
jgi:hypothetical protein